MQFAATTEKFQILLASFLDLFRHSRLFEIPAAFDSYLQSADGT